MAPLPSTDFANGVFTLSYDGKTIRVDIARNSHCQRDNGITTKVVVAREYGMMVSPQHCTNIAWLLRDSIVKLRPNITAKMGGISPPLPRNLARPTTMVVTTPRTNLRGVG